MPSPDPPTGDDEPPRARTRPVLVVDDTPANLVAMEVLLAPLEREVVCVGSGRDALAQLLQREFALVLLDVHMPDMDGFETATMIRSRKRSEHLPIIFVTAEYSEPAEMRRAFALGAVDFLFKPVASEILLAKARVFVTLQDQAEEISAQRLEEARAAYETRLLRAQMDREHAINQQLAQQDRMKDSFIAILGHELRNPLAPVRTAIEMLKEDPQLTPRTLEILDRQTLQLARLVDDLLDIARIKANKIELRREVDDLRAIVEQAVVTSQSQIDERAHRLTVRLPDEAVYANVDAMRMCQVVTNLLNNAARYTPVGGEIDVVLAAEDDRAVVRVRDSGIGIAEALLESVFEMFVQERVRSDGSGGLGLGLALARQLAVMHGGTLAARSAGRDLGSTFEVRLPLAEPPPVVDQAARPPRTTQSVPPLLHHLRIVVVDDNDDARELLCDMLRAKGFTVSGAEDGEAGLALIVAERPDAAFVDLGLPRMDGLAVARGVREALGAAVRLIALTGYGDAANRERTREVGFDGHLVKPTSLSALLAELAGVVPTGG